eukprot:6203037-Pleurochrysis_carterae.AAC.3
MSWHFRFRAGCNHLLDTGRDIKIKYLVASPYWFYANVKLPGRLEDNAESHEQNTQTAERMLSCRPSIALVQSSACMATPMSKTDLYKSAAVNKSVTCGVRPQ